MSLKIKKILISQPEPTSEKSPYSELAEKYGLKLDFHQFIHVEGVGTKDFRKQRINILDHFAIVFTSKTGVDNFFRIADELKIAVPETMKYFCVSESIAFYLQKYIVYRKRKIFYGETGLFKDLIPIMEKQQLPGGRFLLVLSDVYKAEIPQQMDKAKFKYTKGIFYKTVSSNLSNIDIKSYDILAFFSPQGIKSLFYNFPKFKQGNTIIAAFGPTTAKAVEGAGLTLNIPVPTPEALSMPSALEFFIKQQSKPAKMLKGKNVTKHTETPVKPSGAQVKLPEKSTQPVGKSVKPAKPLAGSAKFAVKSVTSAAKSAKPATKPVKPAAKVVKPVIKSVKPAAKPVKPVAKPTKPVAKPVKSAAKSTKSATKPIKPAAKPTKPAAKPIKPAAKPTKSATKSVKPAVKPTKPAAKPVKPAAKSTKSAVKPVKPTAKPTKPAIKPVKPAAKLTKSTAKSVKPVARVAKFAAKH
jgi:uroporphyrinogen-III synthase